MLMIIMMAAMIIKISSAINYRHTHTQKLEPQKEESISTVRAFATLKTKISRF